MSVPNIPRGGWRARARPPHVRVVLWFGLRNRLGRALRVIRELEARLTAVEKRQGELERIRADLAGMIASAENATDKLTRVVERRRKQLADAGDDEVCAHNVPMDEDCEDCALEDLLEQRRSGGNDGREASTTTPPV